MTYDWYIRHLISYLFVFSIFVLLVELVLSARWSPFYFTAGVPIYQRIVMVQSGIERMPTAAEVEAALPESGRSAPMLVRRIDKNSFAFREKLFHFGIGYSPVMHGCKTCHPDTGLIKARGYMNWYIVILLCYFLLFSLAIPIGRVDIIIPLCLMVLLSYIYWMQKSGSGRLRMRCRSYGCRD